MSVAFDAAASAAVAGTGGLSTLTWTHTPVGTPTAVGVTIENFNPTGTVTGVTYGGTAMSQPTGGKSAPNSDGNTAEIWGLTNLVGLTLTGAQNVVITFSAINTFTIAGSITVTGSDPTTCFSNANSATGSTAVQGQPSLACSSASGELVIDIVGTTQSAGTTFTPGGSQTTRWGPLDAPSNRAMGSSAPASAGSTTMSWSGLAASINYSLAAGSFKAAAAGVSGGNLPTMGVG